jgi:hypothetical protein
VSIGVIHLADWAAWALLGVLLWIVVSIPLAIVVGRMLSWRGRPEPMPEATASSLRPAAGASVGAAAEFKVRRRVLLVDDDPALRLLLRAILAADGFEVEEVAPQSRPPKSSVFGDRMLSSSTSACPQPTASRSAASSSGRRVTRTSQ